MLLGREPLNHALLKLLVDCFVSPNRKEVNQWNPVLTT